jgi:adenylylsulfate kinase-like enzyme
MDRGAMTESVIVLPSRHDAPVGVELAIERVRAHHAARRQWLATLGPDDVDDPEGERSFRASLEVATILARLERAQAEDEASPLAQLVRTFRLTPRDRDVLITCLAARLDPSLDLDVRETSVARLFGHGRVASVTGGSPLSRWRLVTIDGHDRRLQIDPAIVPWVVGERATDPALAGSTTMRAAKPPLQAWPVTETVADARRVLEGGHPARIWVVGAPSSGRRTFAADVAAALGMDLLTLDTGAIDDGAWAESYLRAQRQAAMFGVALGLVGERVDRALPKAVPVVPLSFVTVDRGHHDAARGSAALDTVVDLYVDLPALDIEARRRLWMRSLPIVRGWDRRDLDGLAQRHRLTVGEIQSVAARGHSELAAVSEACREVTRRRLGDLGKLVDTPFELDDVIVPARVRTELDAFLHEARVRTAFWENPRAARLYSHRVGLGALFSGPPGTGKTMAAQALAGELGLDLVRIDLASMVSKYIGETAKNLRRVFERAKRMDSVLLFDEADSLFARRTEVRDAHDRHANADVNYLLQQLEEYEGIAILASNQRSQLDPAVVRRLRYIIEFPKPDPAAREQIFIRLVRELADGPRCEVLEPRLVAIAACVELTGAQIKHAMLSAMFAAHRVAAPLAIDHVLIGVERELDKIGQGLRREQKERILQ